MPNFRYVAKALKGEGVISNHLDADNKAEALKKAKAMHPGYKVTLEE